MFKIKRFGCGLAVAMVCTPHLVSAGPLDDLVAPWNPSSPYIGIGAFVAHHTGYVPASRASAETWLFGGKAFAGVQLSPVFSGEATYYHFGEASVKGIAATEESRAVALSLSAGHTFSLEPTKAAPLLEPFVWLLNGTRVFIKSGPAYKWIDQTVTGGATVSEGGLTFLVGTGLERELPHDSFVRLEIEHIGKIGTSAVINVQHTPVTFSFGMRF